MTENHKTCENEYQLKLISTVTGCDAQWNLWDMENLKAARDGPLKL